MSGSSQGRVVAGPEAYRLPRHARKARRTWLPETVRSLRFWIEFFCFFLIATPFELAIGSGYGYAVKALACAALLVPRLMMGAASVDGRFVWASVLAALFLAVNTLEPSVRAMFAFLLIMLGASLGLMKGGGWDRRLLAIVTAYMLVHLAGFAFVLFAFLLRGEVIDLHGMVFPSESRAYAVGATARLSGFHNESGTYAQWMLMATFLRCMLIRRIASMLTVAVGVSMVMTLSLWAIAGAALLVLAMALEVLFRARISKKIQFLVGALLLSQAFMIAITYLPDGVLEDGLAYLQLKSEMSSQSGLDKIMAMAEFAQRLPELIILGNPVVPGFCPYCLSPQDLGLWANSIFYFGLVPSLIILGVLVGSIYRNLGMVYFPFLIAMLLWKAVFYDPFLWIILGYGISLGAGANRFPSDRARFFAG